MADSGSDKPRSPENDQHPDNESGGVQLQDHDTIVIEQEPLIPIASVVRIMKKILPHNTKISKEAKETMQLCTSEFVSFITDEAFDKCQREKRRTITGDDVLWAFRSLNFDDYAELLEIYLQKYRQFLEVKFGIQSVGMESNLSNEEGLRFAGLSDGMSGDMNQEGVTVPAELMLHSYGNEPSPEMMYYLHHMRPPY